MGRRVVSPKKVICAPKTIYFDGCGLLLAYYFGVVRAMEEHGKVDFRRVQLGGASAGSIVAVMLALGLRYKDIRCIGDQIIQWRRSGHGNRYLKSWLDVWLMFLRQHLGSRDLDAAARGIKNLHIRVTEIVGSVGLRPVIVSRFSCFSDLITTVYGSCNIVPFFDGFKCVRDSSGRRLIDGVYVSGSGSVFGEGPGNIMVSPLRKATIYSVRFSILQVIFQSSKNTEIIDAGYCDGKKYFQGERLDVEVGYVNSFSTWLRQILFSFSLWILSVLFRLRR